MLQPSNDLHISILGNRPKAISPKHITFHYHIFHLSQNKFSLDYLLTYVETM